ncbi:peptidase [Kineococcus sp. SYSU DK005]|uniref:peptidase n=1 Tax=Kineococcus sp. SYSU DK005 TaxID=3383126 RepID=UPI003D7C3FC6
MRTKILVATALTGAALVAAAAPSSAAVPPQTAIRFARGAESATVSGHVAAHGDRRYVFDATGGQTVSIRFTRSTSAETWTLVGPTGPSVHNAGSPSQTSFTYRLPDTGRYYLDVVSPRAADYRLQVSIPRGQTIAFPAGGTSATVSARVAAQRPAEYVFAARAGQRAHVQLSGSPTAAFTLTAPDGQPLHTAASEQQRDVSVTLPATGLYRLAVQDATAGTRTLTLSIPAR